MNITQDVALLKMSQNKISRQSAQRNRIDNEGAKEYNRKLREACDGFEEIFVHKMLQVMRNSTEKTGFLSGGRGEEIFQDMLDENYAKMMTKSKSLGLSDLIYEHTKKS
ncbi:rod-binding protein [bacterium]|nr:rod-binding protein [bacterium]